MSDGSSPDGAGAHRVGRMDPAPFAIEVRQVGDRTVLAPSGDIDIATVDELRARLAEAPDPVVLDLREVTFIDTSGLRLVLERHAASGGGISLVAGPPPVQRLFDIAGVADRLAFVEPPADG